jgi:hypothetical protein
MPCGESIDVRKFDDTLDPEGLQIEKSSLEEQSPCGHVDVACCVLSDHASSFGTVICGAVTGSLARPEVVVCGRYRGKDLEVIGRTVPLNDHHAAELAPLLKPAGARHPWPDEIGSGRWYGKNSKVPLVKVRPEVVVEVAADAARQGDHFRHPLRYLRPRADLEPGDVETLT